MPLRMWKAVLLLALHDRADEVWLKTRGGEPEMDYRIDGAYHPLVPPPRGLVALMVETMRELSRPAGFRARVAKGLRALARRIEGVPWCQHHSEFNIGLGEHFIRVEAIPEGEEGIILRLEGTTDQPPEVEAEFRALFERWKDAMPPNFGGPDEAGGEPPDPADPGADPTSPWGPGSPSTPPPTPGS